MFLIYQEIKISFLKNLKKIKNNFIEKMSSERICVNCSYNEFTHSRLKLCDRCFKLRPKVKMTKELKSIIEEIKDLKRMGWATEENNYYIWLLEEKERLSC